MKKRNNIYIILTYLFFIYPPFIWGLVTIYREGSRADDHIVSLIINLILILMIALTCVLLVYKDVLHVPNDSERRHILFGLVGNVVVYFYTFQNLMFIDDYVTIYLILLIVLGVHYILISKKFMAIELWILMPIFLILDLWHLIGTGCGYTDGWSCYNQADGLYLYVIYSIMLLSIVGYYAYRVYLLKQWDILKYINLALVIVLSFIFQDMDIWDDKFPLTVTIMLPFFTIVDFIIKIVNKKYSHKMLFHYIRMYSILFVFVSIGVMGFFKGEANYEILVMMVSIAYVSLFLTIFSYLLKVEDKETSTVSKEIIFGVCNESHIELIAKEFSNKKANLISLNTDDYSLVAMKGEEIVGFISTIKKELPLPNEGVFEALIEIVEINESYMRQGIASKFIALTEKHFKNENIYQIRGWTFNTNINYIKLFEKLRYGLSPTIIKYNNQEYEGYHFIKKF